MNTRRAVLAGALAALAVGPAAATPAFTWKSITWEGRDYMQGSYTPPFGKSYWAACPAKDFVERRADMEKMLRNLV